MKRPVKLIIAVAVLALLVGAYFLVVRLTAEPEQPAETETGNTFLKADGDLTAIEYTFGGETIRLEKSGTKWSKADDSTFPISPDAAATLEICAGSVEVLRTIAPEDADEKLFGLDAPTLDVRAETATGSTLWHVGGYNKAYGGYYARRDGDANVYLITDALYKAFSNGLYAIAQVDEYPAISSVNAVALALTAGDRERDLVWMEGGSPDYYTDAYEWFDVTGGKLEPLRSTAVTVLASDVTGFDFGECVAHAPTEAQLAWFGLDEPALTCDLRYKKYDTADASKFTVETFVLTLGDNGDGGYYVTWTGTDMVFRTTHDAAAALLEALDSDMTPAEICPMALTNITAFEATAGGKTVHVDREVRQVTGEDGTVTDSSVYTVDGFMTDGSNAESFFNALVALKCEAECEEPLSDTAYLTVRFLRNTENFGDMTVTFYEHDANFYRVEFNGETTKLVSIRAVQDLAAQVATLG